MTNCVLYAVFLILGVIGAKAVESPYVEIGQLSTLYYFSHFLVILPLLDRVHYKLLYHSE